MTPDPPRPWPFRPWVVVERGGRSESFAEGLLAVVDDRGEVRAEWGDASFATYVRSSLKMIQALPCVHSGAFDALRLSDEHLALCCASHDGEPEHVAGVARILAGAGLDEGALRCGAHAPGHEASRDALVRAGETPRPIHNNCSGKHAGMLATCRHHGWDVHGYLRPDHPLQVEIAKIVGTLADLDGSTIPVAIDGCGVPTFRIAVNRFAHALARFVAGTGPAAPWAASTARIFDAMNRHPFQVGGSERFCTALPPAANRPILAKGGAEGFYAVAWREDDGRGVALVAKAAAGDSRSRDFAVTVALHQLGLLDDDGLERLRPFRGAPLRNHAGTEVGRYASLMELR